MMSMEDLQHPEYMQILSDEEFIHAAPSASAVAFFGTAKSMESHRMDSEAANNDNNIDDGYRNDTELVTPAVEGDAPYVGDNVTEDGIGYQEPNSDLQAFAEEDMDDNGDEKEVKEQADDGRTVLDVLLALAAQNEEAPLEEDIQNEEEKKEILLPYGTKIRENPVMKERPPQRRNGAVAEGIEDSDDEESEEEKKELSQGRKERADAAGAEKPLVSSQDNSSETVPTDRATLTPSIPHHLRALPNAGSEGQVPTTSLPDICEAISLSSVSVNSSSVSHIVNGGHNGAPAGVVNSSASLGDHHLATTLERDVSTVNVVPMQVLGTVLHPPLLGQGLHSQSAMSLHSSSPHSHNSLASERAYSVGSAPRSESLSALLSNVSLGGSIAKSGGASLSSQLSGSLYTHDSSALASGSSTSNTLSSSYSDLASRPSLSPASVVRIKVQEADIPNRVPDSSVPQPAWLGVYEPSETLNSAIHSVQRMGSQELIAAAASLTQSSGGSVRRRDWSVNGDVDREERKIHRRSQSLHDMLKVVDEMSSKYSPDAQRANPFASVRFTSFSGHNIDKVFSTKKNGLAPSPSSSSASLDQSVSAPALSTSAPAPQEREYRLSNASQIHFYPNPTEATAPTPRRNSGWSLFRFGREKEARHDAAEIAGSVVPPKKSEKKDRAKEKGHICEVPEGRSRCECGRTW